MSDRADAVVDDTNKGLDTALGPLPLATSALETTPNINSNAKESVEHVQEQFTTAPVLETYGIDIDEMMASITKDIEEFTVEI